MNVTLDGAFGPNRCQISHSPDRQMIQVESEFQLLVQDMREIEEYLNLKMQLGMRWLKASTCVNYTWTTVWNYLESPDCDWS